STVVNGKEGELVTVEVKLLACPEPIMSVYQNDEHMPYSDRVTVSVSQEGMIYSFALIITESSMEDSGSITFVANNEFGMDKVTIDLMVEPSSIPVPVHDFVGDPAKVVIPLQNTIVKEGETARLRGRVAGFPLPEVILLRDGLEVNLEFDDRIEFLQKPNGEIILNVLDCSPFDDDEYT
ncbi:hypothetical protein PMAYCL1PPCAC_28831, partial [Pristionchus mayeri]